MKKIILIFLLYFLQISNLFAQKSAKTVEEEAKAWIAKFEKMDPLQKKQASSKLVNFLNNTDNYTKGIWLANLEKLDAKDKAKRIEAEKERKLKDQALQEQIREEENKKKLEKIAQEKYNSSDYVKIITPIQEQFENWLIKNEFETSDQYNKRLQTINSVFDSISYQEVINFIGSQIISERMVTPMLGYEKEIKQSYSSIKGPGNITIKVEPYNADEEFYPLNISFKDLNFVYPYSMPIEMAKKIWKEIEVYDDSNSGHSGFVQKWREFSIEYPNIIYDWVLLNHNLYPTKFTLKFNDDAKTKHEIIIPLQNTNKISISSKNMQLNKFNGNPLNFELDNYLKRLNNKEIQLADSDSSIVLDLKLVDSFDVDGMIILNFTNDKGEEFQFNSIEESLINTYFKTNEDNETILLPEFLNKKFKVSYISKKIKNEEYEANGEDGEYIEDHILKMTVITEN